jgi:hypothetical protein
LALTNLACGYQKVHLAHSNTVVNANRLLSDVRGSVGPSAMTTGSLTVTVVVIQ